jgi:hypothetical protein
VTQFDTEAADKRWNDRINALAPEERLPFQKGYVFSSADAVGSITSIIDSDLSDQEKLSTLHSLMDAMQMTIQVASLLSGEEYFD